MLPVVVTMSVHGQALHVGFEFDLVNDDPINVAREMVADLGISEEKALEISRVMNDHVERARIIWEAKQRQYQLQQQEEHIVRKIKSLAFQIHEQERQLQQQVWMFQPKQ